MGGRSGFVGRGRELEVLSDAWERARRGTGGLALIAGEAGIGKTRLCEELVDLAREDEATVAWAVCWESGSPALQPWADLLVTLASPAVPEPLLDDLTGPADLAYERMVREIITFLRDASRERPCVLVVDDLHWADSSSLRLLQLVAPAVRSLPVLLVATYRSAAKGSDDRFDVARRGLRRAGNELQLEGLSADEVGALIAVTRGESSTPPQHIELMHRHTGGNPLFVHELVRLAGQEGSFDEIVTTMSRLPGTVIDAISARLEPVPVRVQDELKVAAAAGGELRLDILEGVLGKTRTDVVDLIGIAEAHGLVEPLGGGRVRFVHPLVRDVLYGRLTVPERAHLHQQLGEMMTELRLGGHDIDPAVIAEQFARSAAAGGPTDAAVRWGIEAARSARAVNAYEDTARWLERTLELLDSNPGAGDRIEVLLALGDALIAAGDLPRARRTYLDAATLARLARPHDLARAALGVGSGGGFEIDLSDAVQRQLLEEALAAVGDEEHVLRSQLLARLSIASAFTSPVKHRARIADEAVALSRRTTDPTALAQALAARCDARAGPADAELRDRDGREITMLGPPSADPRIELLGRRLRVVALLEQGDLIGFDREVDAYAATADALSQPLYSWYVPLWRGLRAAHAGDVERHRRLVDEAARIGELAHSANALMLTVGQRWLVHLELGERERAGEATEEIRAAGVAVEEAELAVSVALGWASTGRQEEARALLTRAENGIRSKQQDSEWLAMLAQLAGCVSLIGGHVLAEWAYEEMLPHRHRCAVDGIGLWWHGSVERHLGVLAGALGRHAAAADHFDAALLANRRFGPPLISARTLLDAGTALDDRDRLAAALDAYRELGIGARVADLEQCLGRARRRPVAPTETIPGRLVREGEVWLFEFGGSVTRVKDSKGVRDLATLLSAPGREVSALDLAGAGSVDAHTGEAIDATARDDYKRRLREVEAELTDADADGDVGRSAALIAERDALVAQLAGAYGLGGRVRRPGSTPERARTAVTARIRDAIRRLEAAQPELGRHLDRCVRTGTFCVYDPEPPTRWNVVA